MMFHYFQNKFEVLALQDLDGKNSANSKVSWSMLNMIIIPIVC